VKPDTYINRGARISSCGLYRYSLWREWRGTHYRATKPRDVLRRQNAREEIIGLHNSEIMDTAARDAGLIVCAWGSNATALDPTHDHVETVRGWLRDKPMHALGFTKDGQPRHPLYAPSDSALVPMPQ
jgi:hypothetical protein